MHKDLLSPFIKKMVSHEVTEVVCGGSNGSIIILDINLCSLFVYCAWRLENENVLTGWHESSDPSSGNLAIQAKKLEGDVLIDYKISDKFDLILFFKSGKKLNVFCDITPNYPNKDSDENWTICDKENNSCVSINNKFDIITEPYN